MRVSFQYTKNEYVNAFWENSKKRLNPKLDAVMIVSALIGGGWLLAVGETQWGWLIIVPVALLGSMLLAIRYLVPGLLFKRVAAQHGEHTFDFMPEGIRLKTNEADIRLEWSTFTRAKKTKDLYFLYYGKGKFSFIPRRVFSSDKEQKEFEQLLKDHIKEIDL